MRSTHSYPSNTRELNRALKAPPAGSDYGLRPSQGQSRFKSPIQLQRNLPNNECKGNNERGFTASFIEMKGVFMQRNGILNSHIAKVLADLGHTDTICISDCGLPVPEGVQKIDLALDFGVPSFEQVVSIIAKHMKSEAVHVAKEIKENNPEAYDFLESTFPSNQYEWIETSHEAFKEATKQCKCIIRTGEASPYANIILRADCIFSDRP